MDDYLSSIQQKLHEGREEGIKIGEEKAKTEVAKNLLKPGVPIDVIAESTGFHTDKIKDLV